MSEPINATNADQLTELAQTRCGFVSQLAWSPDGSMLALAHGGGFWLWTDNLGGDPPRVGVGHSGPVKSVAFDPHGQVIATASADTTVRLWMATSVESITIVRAHSHAVNVVAFSPDGRMLASAGGDGRIHILDMVDSAGTLGFEGHANEITGLAFGENTLASGGWDKTIRLWDLPTRAPRMIIPLDDWVRDLAASPDGQVLAAACKDGAVRLIDFATGAIQRTIAAHEGGADCVTFSPDGTLLVTGGRDNVVKLWDLSAPSDQPVARLTAHQKPVLTVAYHPDGTLIASGSGDNTVRLWGLP